MNQFDEQRTRAAESQAVKDLRSDVRAYTSEEYAYVRLEFRAMKFTMGWSLIATGVNTLVLVYLFLTVRGVWS